MQKRLLNVYWCYIKSRMWYLSKNPVYDKEINNRFSNKSKHFSNKKYFGLKYFRKRQAVSKKETETRIHSRKIPLSEINKEIIRQRIPSHFVKFLTNLSVSWKRKSRVSFGMKVFLPRISIWVPRWRNSYLSYPSTEFRAELNLHGITR